VQAFDHTTRHAVGGAVAAEVPSTVTPLVVPQALAERSRIEISGAVWLPERSRFLVVSDDTGFKKRNDDIPWVFMVDKAGRMDPDPIEIDGVDEISDLEAITRDGEGWFYLVCSQSMNKKGKRKPKRTWLLRARLEGPRLRVQGAVRLWALLRDHLTDAQRAELGVDESLDIEGMTWFDGGLAFGLKSPGDGSGRARLWHLTQVGALFTAGLGAQGAVLRPMGSVNLPIGSAKQPGGISELLADGDGLYVLSTLAEGPASGAAWYLETSQARPRLLAEWPDRKPEGLARGPDGLRVFFDEGDKRAPTWTPLVEAR